MLVTELNICRKTNVMSNALGKMFITLVTGYRNKAFVSFADRVDMESDALLHLTRTWYNYDPAKNDNMVAVFNAVIHTSFKTWAANALKEGKLSQQLQDLTPDE